MSNGFLPFKLWFELSINALNVRTDKINKNFQWVLLLTI